MREIEPNEISKLYDCICELSEHHNDVSVNFKGYYPLKPYEKTLESFEAALRNQESYIAVTEIENRIIGFCKVDINGESGKLDYLVVKEEFRGKGFGKELMDWAMQMFDQNNVKHLEVKVVDGNKAIHLYEKYGFKMKSHILGIERSISA
ncbi:MULTISPECIES: GNAT family N-acetyltransferase [unclassified Butyrivibrio]|jgi:ribosomal protein S18 acetylase RimI-like enzyme|uniref:GNAT family N-acetyltransferase n=1 Tax=unclassified Butyrivibrio TaxID=2639466 RepID=UPI0003B55F37|nr:MULTISPECIES: GNAT family N-acetyltransferase [unclassified Butyrivibrio]MDC7293832.1 GNAT family N-acetyltransferase [Butyrivibrio sp. DSM 10294]